MVEFVVNNNDLVFIKLFPFFILKNLYLWTSFNIIDFSDITIHKRINKKKTINISKDIQLI